MWGKHCTPLSSKIMQRISKILKAILKERPNTPYFDAYSPTICNEEFFQKSHHTQTIFPIILYNHAKVGKILRVAMDIMQRNTRPRWTGWPADGQGSIYRTSLQSWWIQQPPKVGVSKKQRFLKESILFLKFYDTSLNKKSSISMKMDT